MRLKDKVAIVTGGDTGIGKSISLELAREGANVVIDYYGDHNPALFRLQARERDVPKRRYQMLADDLDVFLKRKSCNPSAGVRFQPALKEGGNGRFT
jgi:NAD(P)-dependent dehydrogenase (short-subunit alcohol dehydrogenase family)